MQALGVGNLGEFHVDESVYKAAMRKFITGPTIISTGTIDNPVGMTASAVSSLSTTPPSIIACVNKSASVHDAIIRSGKFAVNALCDHHQELAAVFAGRDGLKGAERFRFGKWTSMLTGSPMLRDALVGLDCTLEHRFDGGTHSVFMGRVIAVSCAEIGKPLAYCMGAYGTLSQ